MEEERIFIELLRTADGRVNISVGGGSSNNGIMEEYGDLASAIKDLEKRVVIDYMRLKDEF